MGNCVNAVLVGWLASSTGEVVLRIDDADQARYRPAYADDIFRTLAWLDIRVDDGPRNPRELVESFSQKFKRRRYLEVANHALDLGLAHGCACPRHVQVCTCADRIVWTPGSTALRLRTPGAEPGPVLWRRDDIPAYLLTSVVDDHDMAITHVVRGEDLLETSDLQRNFAADIGLMFPIDVRHHELIRDANGSKLSKSTGTRGPMVHDEATRDRIVDLSIHAGEAIGIQSPD